jgi:hypothetical protein
MNVNPAEIESIVRKVLSTLLAGDLAGSTQQPSSVVVSNGFHGAIESATAAIDHRRFLSGDGCNREANVLETGERASTTA